MQIRIAQLEDECQKLREENASLRNQLGLEPKSSHTRTSESNNKSVSVKPSHQAKATPELSIDTKIQLFRSLSKGREDVYSIRWDSKNGRSGYTPACDNEWLSGVCDKPRVKCSNCNNRKLLSINYQAIYLHLTGKKLSARMLYLPMRLVGFWRQILMVITGKTMLPLLRLRQKLTEFTPVSKFQDLGMALMSGFSLPSQYLQQQLGDWVAL